MPFLRVTAGPQAGQQFPLADGSFDLGRDPSSGISLAQDPSVSRRHAQISVQNGQVTIRDAGSSFGVFVNGSRTPATILASGDKIQVGNSTLTLEADPPVVVPTAEPPPLIAPPPGAYAPVPGSPAGIASPYPAAAGSPYAGPSGSAPGAGYPPAASFGPPPAGYAPPAYGSPPPAVPFAKWLYFLGFSIPPIGIIVGLIYVLKETPDERRVGWWCIFWSVLGGILLWVSWVECMRLLDVLWPMIQHSNGMGGGNGLGIGGSGMGGDGSGSMPLGVERLLHGS